jgi:aminomethyltransferase
MDSGGAGFSAIIAAACRNRRLEAEMSAQAAVLSQPLKRTPLYDAHVEAGARMVEFAGYAMPVQYPDGILKEHQWTRAHAGLFDVSHMGPAWLRGAADHAAAAAVVERLVCGDIAGLKPGQLRYTLLLNEDGGIVDDLMIGRPAEPERQGELYVVVNAGTKEGDFARIAQAAGGAARLERADDGALVAIQGPEAVQVLARVLPGCEALGFMSFAAFDWQGERLVVSRSGYTGEDGFEILVPARIARDFWSRLAADERVRPVGLGARDSLRLEAGLPLYGHDLDETTSPIEAGLGFAVSRRRREAGDFPGAGRILREIADGPRRVRVGLLVEGAPAREGAEVTAEHGSPVGQITSGGFSPTLGRPIALAFVDPRHSAPGARLHAIVRGKPQTALATSLPFVPHRYVRNP